MLQTDGEEIRLAPHCLHPDVYPAYSGTTPNRVALEPDTTPATPVNGSSPRIGLSFYGRLMFSGLHRRSQGSV